MTESLESAPVQLADLTQGEHMLLWGFRAVAFGRSDCRLVRQTFDDACGPIGREIRTALSVFVRELGVTGRRKVSLGAPGSFRLTRDEQLILAVFAAAQAEDYPRLEAHLTWLTAEGPRAPFPACACLVAQGLALNGLLLRLPAAETPQAPALAPARARTGRLKLA